MTFEVSKTFVLDCPGQLVTEVNADVAITTVCENIRFDEPDAVKFRFAGAGPLSGAEITALDLLISGFSCTPVVDDTVVTFPSGITPNPDDILRFDGTIWIVEPPVDTNDLIRVSATDTTPGRLGDKLTLGSTLSSTIINPGGNEQVQLDATITTDDITDLTLTSITTGDVLEWNGTTFVNVAGSGIGGGGGSISVDRQQVSAISTFVTSSNTLVDLTDMTLTTHNLSETGTYTITFSCEYQHMKDDKDITFSLNVGGTEVMTRRTAGYKKNQWGAFSMSYLSAGVASGTTIKMQAKQAYTGADKDLTIEARQLIIDGTGDSNVV